MLFKPATFLKIQIDFVMVLEMCKFIEVYSLVRFLCLDRSNRNRCTYKSERRNHFFIRASIKNITVSRTYMIKKWPGDSELRNQLSWIFFIALMTWLCILGNRTGYLFFNLNEKFMILMQKLWYVP